MTIRSVAPLITVRDVPASVRFYRRLGFEPAVEWPTYAKLAHAAGVLHLAAQGDAPPDRPSVALSAPQIGADRVGAIVVLEVDDCHKYCAGLAASGVELLGDPATPPWGGEIRAFLRDPDGHLIEVNQPVGEAADGG